MFKLLILTICIFSTSYVESSVSGYIRSADQSRYLNLLNDGLSSEDVANVHYSLRGLSLLGKTAPADKSATTCKTLTNVLTKGKLTPEFAYYVSVAKKLLPTCNLNFNDAFLKSINDVLTSESSTIPDLHYASVVLANLGKPNTNAAKVVQTLQTKLKTEDTLINLGHTFNAAAVLGVPGKFALDRVEEALVQADEVDGKMLQFEGGLSVTSLLLVGITKLAQSQNKPSLITKVQAEKFANYLISRRSVQSLKGVASLLDAVRSITDNKDLSPASIALAGSGHVTAAVAVRVCDMLGRPLNLPADAVVAQSATRLGDDVVVLAKQKLTLSSDPTVYNLDLPRDRMAAGLYRVAISAASHTASLTVTALAVGAISNFQIGVADADQTSAAKLQRLDYPKKIGKLEADNQQVVVIKFAFTDANTNKILKTQQAFLRFTNQKTARELVFLAEFDPSTNLYTINLDIGSKAALFGGYDGIYDMSLILGDTVVSNPIVWDIGELSLNLPAGSKGEDSLNPRGPKPEIHHQFREAERRPPQLVSMCFTGLAAAPILLLFILWAKLGINVSNFPVSVSAIVFHLGLASIFGLFGVFWLSLNMFQTSRWLLLLGAITFLSGHRLLRSIAEKRKA